MAMRRLLSLLALLIATAPAVAAAQADRAAVSPTPVRPTEVAPVPSLDPARSAWVLPDGPYLLAAILSGLVLAVAFQMILTNFSVAAGVSMLGPLDEGANKGGRGKKMSMPSAEDVVDEARGITRGFGLWAVITTALALLFASWLAVSLSLTHNPMIGAILGLVIWGLFYILLTSVEAAAASSAVGALIKMATAGYRAVAGIASSLIEPSARKQAADAAEGMTRAVADVLQNDGDVQRLKRELRDYLRELKPRRLEPGAVRKQVAKLFDDLELHALSAGGSGPVIDVNEVVADLRSRGTLEAEDVGAIGRGLSEALKVIREEAGDPDKGRLPPRG